MKYIENMTVYKYPEQQDEIRNMLGYIMENNLFSLCVETYIALQDIQPVIDTFYKELNSCQCTDVIYYIFIIDANKYFGFTLQNKEAMHMLMKIINWTFLKHYPSFTSVQQGNLNGQYILNIAIGVDYEDRSTIPEDKFMIWQYLNREISNAKDEAFSGKISWGRYYA